MTRRAKVRAAIGIILGAIAVECCVVLWWIAANWSDMDFTHMLPSSMSAGR